MADKHADRFATEKLETLPVFRIKLQGGNLKEFVMRRKEYHKGQVLGGHGARFIKEVSPHISPKGRKCRKALFQCGKCGSKFETTITKVSVNHTKSCGCYLREVMVEMKGTHGLTGHPMHNLWRNIKARTTNPNEKNYKYYGGRGIYIADYWANDAESFVKYVTSLPKYNKREKCNLTLDRIDNDKSYIKGNLRWATPKEQNNNRRDRIDSASGYNGIYWRKEINKWVVYALAQGKRFYGGSFNVLADAVLKRNYILREVKNV